MKKSFIVLLFLIFCGLSYLVEETNSTKPIKSLAKSEIEMNSSDAISDYFITAKLELQDKLLKAKQKIIWRNKTSHSTNKIYFHLFPNAYKSNNTQLAQKKIIPTERRTSIEIHNLTVNGESKQLIFEDKSHNELSDSTVAYILLDTMIDPNDSLIIESVFEIRIPKTLNGIGYYPGEDFYFFSKWFPKIGVFKNNQWHCSRMFSEYDFYSEFSNYEIKLEVPNSLIVGGTGNLVDLDSTKINKRYLFKENKILDFAWFAAREIMHTQSEYKTANGREVKINAYVQEMRDWYTERSINAVKYALEFLGNNFGEYKYGSISLVDLPSDNRKLGRAFPTLIPYNTDLLSPEDLQSPEKEIINKTVQQYFSTMISTNQVVEAWLDEGICSYLTSKILKEYYGDENLSFKLATYFPVNGINFISYNEIPLVYTLGDYTYPLGTEALKKYYKNLRTGTIADTSFLHPTELAYEVNTKCKPELVLLTLERYSGEEFVMETLKTFFSRYKFKHPEGNDFFNIIKESSDQDLTWFKENFYTHAYYFDYGVTDIQAIGENEYSVLCRRFGDGIFPVDVVLYTDKDTLYKKWDGTDTWIHLSFSTENEVIAAEIDPKRVNLLDINFANNSYTVNPQYFITFSLSLRWLFWVQNMLMILGSAG